MALTFKPGVWSYRTKMWVLTILTLIVIAAVFMLPPIPQSLSYHHFADTRTIWGIPNFANTISNFPFLLTGMTGLLFLNRAGGPGVFKIIYALLFTGIILTGFGSAFYHWNPDNYTLIFDRIPMTIVFMSLLAATVSEQIDLKWGSRLLIPLILLGIASIIWWHYTESMGKGDLRLYGLVQFYPVLFIPLSILLPLPFRKVRSRFPPIHLGRALVYYRQGLRTL